MAGAGAVRRYPYETHQQLEDHLAPSWTPTISLAGSRPYEASQRPSVRLRAAEPERYRRDPVHLTLGLNT